MPIPLALLYPLIGAALGAGTQAARGKKGGDIWKGAALGAGAGLGGWGMLGAGAGSAGAAGAGAAGTAAGTAGAGAAGTAGAGAAAGSGLGAGFSSLASGTAKSMAPAMLMSAISQPPDMEATNYGSVPEIQSQQDPFLWVQQLLQQRRAM